MKDSLYHRGTYAESKAPRISIILPTYNEADNVGALIPEICGVLNRFGLSGEIIVVDDNSPDGTAAVCEDMKDDYPLRLVVRKQERGLATAVITGFATARGDVCLVMDADGSHPPAKIPDMARPILEKRCRMTIGTRYRSGGGCHDWPLIRKIISRGAGFLARGLTPVSDPTTGFMAVERRLVKEASLDPVGWKIVLEVMVKTGLRPLEVPFVFVDREKCLSKLNTGVQIDYLRHLFRLYCFKYADLFQFIRFCLVGLSGLLVDTAILVCLVELFMFDPRLAAIIAFCGAVSWNFVLNRRWTFQVDDPGGKAINFFSFVIVCTMGLMLRVGIMHVLIQYAGMDKTPWYILANMIGVFFGTFLNFMGAKYIVFNHNTSLNYLKKHEISR